MKESTSPTKAIAEVLGFNEVKSTEAMRACPIQEPVIIKDYIQERKKHVNVSVEHCGLFIYHTYGFLGASPDGIITEQVGHCKSMDLLEMK